MMKTCNRCGQEKVLDCFSRHPLARDGYNTQCKSCIAEKVKIRRALDPQKHLERARKWKRENPEKVKSGKVAYRLANPEKVKEARKSSYQRNKEAELSKARAYKHANKEKLSAIASEKTKAYPVPNRLARSRRRAAEAKATPAWFNRVKVNEIYFVADVLSEITGQKYHVDHVVPLVSKIVCGLHCEANLQILTAHANQSKSNHYWPNMPMSLGVHK